MPPVKNNKKTKKSTVRPAEKQKIKKQKHRQLLKTTNEIFQEMNGLQIGTPY